MTVPELCIREAFEKDINVIFEIEKEAFSDPYPRELLKAFLYFPGAYIVALCQDVVIGYAIGIIERKDQGHIISIAVKSDHRRSGTGGRMLEELKDRLVNAGAKSIRLEVRESNLEALALYKNKGYVEGGRMQGYYNDGETALVMYLSLQ
jgi:ribosomal-protein-alanine N-acetyltransferase